MADWRQEEVEACVADYLEMLALELNGQRFNKTDHANALMRKLDNRNRASIEFKHSNISAVMLELGYPSIAGYKPRSNYQSLLKDVVEAQLEANPNIGEAAEAAVTRPAILPGLIDSDRVWVPPPKASRINEARVPYEATFAAVKRDYLAQESQNRSLGIAGELFVIEIEARRLHTAGHKRLADRIEHVAKAQGDGLGYDVLSFDTDGRERLIEVKTTAFGQMTPFYVSRNEVARSESNADSYHIYRVFDFRRNPRLFGVQGSIRASFDLAPTTFLARIAATR